MKTKKAIFHIETNDDDMDLTTYCGQIVILSGHYEKVKNKTPLCKNCLRAMEAEARRRE